MKHCFFLTLISTLFLTGCGSEINTDSPESINPPVDTTETVPSGEEIGTRQSDQEAEPREAEKQELIHEDTPSSTSPIPMEKLSQVSHIDKKNRIWIEETPYEVWFESPLKVLGNPELLSLNRKQKTPGPSITKNDNNPATASKQSGPQKPVKSGSAVKNPLWQKLITEEMIQDEVKSLRNQLNGSFRSVGQFNKSLDQIGIDCTTLAALGFLVKRDGYSVSWKESAEKIIQLAINIGESSAARGRQNFNKGKGFFDQLSSILGGNQSVPVEIPKENFVFSDIAERSSIMEKMEQISKQIDSDINSQKKFESEQDKLIRDTALLAILSNLILDESYESSDEKEYQDAGANMLKDALDLSNSAAEKEYPRWNEVKNLIRKRCDQCHEEYRL